MDHGHTIKPMIHFKDPVVRCLNLPDAGSCSIEDSSSPLRNLSRNLKLNRGPLFIARVKLSPSVVWKERKGVPIRGGRGRSGSPPAEQTTWWRTRPEQMDFP